MAMTSIQAVPSELPLFINKLLMTCSVTIERIKPFSCEVCDTVYCHREGLINHLATHIIKEEIDNDIDTMRFEESSPKHNSVDSNAALNVGDMYNIKSEVVDLASGPAFLSIRDRIKFEPEDTIDTAMRATCMKKVQNRSTDDNNLSLKMQKMMYMCHICMNFFLTKRQLSLHLKFHISDKPWKCDICEKTFKGLELVKRHQRVHTDERPYSCKICNIRYRNYSSLGYHNRKIHTPEEEQPTCGICGKRYWEKFHLQRHMLSVHMTKGYRCHICKNKKEYGHPVNLAKHMYTHNGNPYKCDYCQNTYLKKFHMQRHVELTHKKITKFECDLCKKKFGRKEHMLRHILDKCCSEPYKCRRCKSSFTKVGDLRKHYRIHEHKCKYCVETFRLKRCLQQHVKMVHKKKGNLGKTAPAAKRRVQRNQLRSAFNFD